MVVGEITVPCGGQNHLIFKYVQNTYKASLAWNFYYQGRDGVVTISDCNISNYLAPGMDDVDSESIDSISANIISVDTGDENLPLVIVAEQPTNHGEVSMFYTPVWNIISQSQDYKYWCFGLVWEAEVQAASANVLHIFTS